MFVLNGFLEIFYWIKYIDIVLNVCNICIYGYFILILLVIIYINFSYEGIDNIYFKCIILIK